MFNLFTDGNIWVKIWALRVKEDPILYMFVVTFENVVSMAIICWSGTS